MTTDIIHDSAAFRDYFIQRIPDESCRSVILTLLADSIERAHQIGGDRWMLSFDGTYVRLHIGNYNILEIGKNYVWLAFEANGLSSATIERLQRLRNWEYPRFKGRPTSASAYIDCSEIQEVLPLIRDSYQTFLHEAATAQPVHTKVRGTYAAGLVAYLRSALSRDLPDPLVPAGIPPVERTVIEQAFQEFDQTRRPTRYWQRWEHDPSYRYAVLWSDKRYPVKEIVRLATGVQDLDSVQARSYLAERGFEIVTLRASPSNIWLFQANPRYYDLADRLRQATVGDEDVWTVTRYGNEMQAGDPVVFWLSGAEAGIYAVGELTGTPVERTYAPGESPPWIARENADKPVNVEQVPFRYTQILAEPITKTVLQADPTLGQLQVIRQPNATNFRLTEDEWASLQQLLPIGSGTGLPALMSAEGRRVAFDQFREDPYNRFMVAIRRARAHQLQALLSGPATLTLEGFNRDVWQIESATLRSGSLIRPPIVDNRTIPTEQLTLLEAALKENSLELHGNYIWRAASTTYHPHSKDDAKKLDDVQRMAAILSDASLTPREKARRIDALPGFGDNTATGLVMVFHPDAFAIYNKQSREGLHKLGIVVGDMDDFQEAVAALKTELGADDYLELDLFLYLINQSVVAPRQVRVWWVNQGTSFTDEQEHGYLWAPLRDSVGRTQGHWKTMAEVRPGDIIIHYTGEQGISAVSRVTEAAVEAPRPEATDDRPGRLVKAEYWAITPPRGYGWSGIELRTLIPDGGPFDKNGGVRQGYLWRFSLDALRALRKGVDAEWPQWVDDLLEIDDDGERPKSGPVVPPEPTTRSFAGLLESLRAAGLTFPVELVSQYLLALQSKRFVIFTGISGTGKTQLAMAVAAYYADADQPDRVVIAVRPDWTDQRGLLGFYNPLTRAYVTTPFLRFLLDASTEYAQARQASRAPRPFFVVLDEMNLARVEYYFADFLSSLESGEPLSLHDDAGLEAVGADGAQVAVPRHLRIPDNLFFTGTVNVDETTSMFSPKVLDRAFTIEFNHVDLPRFGAPSSQIAEEQAALILHALPDSLLKSVPASDLSKDQAWKDLTNLEGGALRQIVELLHDLLAQESRHFGYRVANEIARFVTLADAQAGGTSAARWAALDLAVLAKILPKLNGTQQELSELLVRLFDVAIYGVHPQAIITTEQQALSAWRASGGMIISTLEADAPATARLPRTAAKLWTMLRRLRQQGFVSFVV